MPEISVIMPVYNSENYLKESIESILKQSFSDFELILVDDGSTDSSGEICDYYDQRDRRIKVIHQKNGGISNARNTGIIQATGKYIIFADNDDEFNNNLLEDNYFIAKNRDVDIVKFGIKYLNKEINNTYEVNIRNIDSIELSKENIWEKYLFLKNNNIFVYVWDAIFKAELIKDNNIKFNENFILGGEDINFNLSILPYVEKMYINKKKYYTHYKRASHSTSVKFNKKKLNSFILNAQKEFKLLNKYVVDSKKKYIWTEIMSIHIWQILIALTKIKEMRKKEKIHFLEKLKKTKPFIYKIDSKIIIDIFKNNKKRAIFLLLFKEEQYRFLYWIANIIS